MSNEKKLINHKYCSKNTYNNGSKTPHEQVHPSTRAAAAKPFVGPDGADDAAVLGVLRLVLAHRRPSPSLVGRAAGR